MTYQDFLRALDPKAAWALVAFPSLLTTGAAMGWMGFSLGILTFVPSLGLFAFVFWRLIPFLLEQKDPTRTVGLSLAIIAGLALAALVMGPSVAVITNSAR